METVTINANCPQPAIGDLVLVANRYYAGVVECLGVFDNGLGEDEYHYKVDPPKISDPAYWFYLKAY